VLWLPAVRALRPRCVARARERRTALLANLKSGAHLLYELASRLAGPRTSERAVDRDRRHARARC
jgi:hypothetical protein